MKDSHLRYHSGADSGQTYFSRHDLPSASRRRKMLPCTEEEVEALFYFISNLYLTLYPIRTLSIPFPNFTAVHGVGVAQAKPACKHTIATRKCYQYNTLLAAWPGINDPLEHSVHHYGYDSQWLYGQRAAVFHGKQNEFYAGWPHR